MRRDGYDGVREYLAMQSPTEFDLLLRKLEQRKQEFEH
jgi:hypothetical protein